MNDGFIELLDETLAGVKDYIGSQAQEIAQLRTNFRIVANATYHSGSDEKCALCRIVRETLGEETPCADL